MKMPGEHWQGMVNKTCPYCDLWESGQVGWFVYVLPEKLDVIQRW